MRQKKQASEKKTRRKKTNTEDPNPVIESDAEPEPDPSESGLQSHEISNNECSLCFNLYEDDF